MITVPASTPGVPMTGRDAANMPDGRDLLRGMGWISLPFSCVGLVRKTGTTSNASLWSWLILVPWTSDGKPWIDGTDVVPASTKSDDDERELMIAKMRSILDDRYGDSVAQSAVDDLIEEIFDEI
jgi:hypothetical protein